MEAAGAGDASAEGVVFEQGLDGLSEIFRLVRDPDVDRMLQAEAGATGGRGDDRAIHGHRFQDLEIGAGRDQRGDDGEVRFDVQRANVGNKFEQPDAIVFRNGREPGVFAPVEQRIGAGDYCKRDLRGIFAQDGPNLFDEKSIGHDVGKMPERADEEEAFAGALHLRRESRQIHAVRDHGDSRPVERARDPAPT